MAGSNDDIDDRKLTLGAHLDELRGHVFKCLGWLLVAFVLCFALQEPLMKWATRPHTDTIERIYDDKLTEIMGRYMSASARRATLDAFRGHKSLDLELKDLERNAVLYRTKVAADPGKRMVELATREQALIDQAQAIKADQEKLLDHPDAARFEELERKRLALVEEARQLREAIQTEVAPLLDFEAKFPRFELIQLSYMESFMAYLKISLVCALFLASPLIARQLWQFVAAGLHRHEKKWVRVFAPVSLVAFVIGAAFGYYVLIPQGLKFLATYGADYIQGQFALSEYLSLFINMTLVVGLIFELPLIMTFLSLIGVVKAEAYGRFRRYWILAATVIAAIIAPTPDPFTLLLCTGPLIVLYEVGIVLARFVTKKNEPPEVVATASSPAT